MSPLITQTIGEIGEARLGTAKATGKREVGPGRLVWSTSVQQHLYASHLDGKLILEKGKQGGSKESLLQSKKVSFLYINKQNIADHHRILSQRLVEVAMRNMQHVYQMVDKVIC